MDVGVAALGVAFGFLFIVRHTATTHHHVRSLPERRVARASIKLFRGALILGGVMMVVAFTKPLPPVSRVLVSMVVAISAVSLGWFAIPAVTNAFRRRAGLRRAARLQEGIDRQLA